jgi:hypothetical protein
MPIPSARPVATMGRSSAKSLSLPLALRAFWAAWPSIVGPSVNLLCRAERLVQHALSLHFPVADKVADGRLQTPELVLGRAAQAID